MVRPRCWLDVATFDFFGQALRDDALSTLRKLGKLLHEETEIHALSFSAECLQLAQTGGWMPGRACPLCTGISDINLFCYCESIVHFDAEISYRAFDLGVAEQKLDSP
jgi:hypothetical protein